MKYEVVTTSTFLDSEKRTAIDDPEVMHIKVDLGNGDCLTINEQDGELLITAAAALQIETVACNRVAVTVKP